MTMVPPAVASGTNVAGYEVTGARGDNLFARSPTGEPVVLVFGSELSLEQEALRRLSAHSPVPRTLEAGADAVHGPFLVLSGLNPSARLLAEIAPSLRVAGAVSLLRQLVNLVERMAREGFHWAPFAQDLHVAQSGTLTLSRVRCAGRHDASSPAAHGPDVRLALEAAGASLLPLPGALGPSRLVRILSSRALRATGALLTPAAAREEIARIESEMTAVPAETAKGISELSDRGFRPLHNEDATAVAGGEIASDAKSSREPLRSTGAAPETWAVLVVCDGVSSSTNAAIASSIAATTARDALAHFALSGAILSESAGAAMAAAVRAAHVAICAASIHDPRDIAEPPGTTLVAALVFRRKVVIGWAGDSRAYWISPTGAELLTRDHSWAAEAVARGELTEAEAAASPHAHAITRCLGPLETCATTVNDFTPEVTVREIAGPGHLVLCTDGLWNYFPSAAELASVVRAAGAKASTATIARCLVNHALARGGEDNVSVAVLARARA